MMFKLIYEETKQRIVIEDMIQHKA